MDFVLTSNAFGESEAIPADYTCDGANVSPPLSWIGAPPGTARFALVLEDLDAPSGIFTHWLLFDIPADTADLPEDVPNIPQPDNLGIQGRNDFGHVGYGGPCPPPGKPHRYRFSLSALDGALDLPAGASRQQVLAAASDHALARAELMAQYQRMGR
jgi:Raf kinase inhibitor-like YbhB/YbcL family protein